MKKKAVILISLTCTITLLGLIVPGVLLKVFFNNKLNKAYKVDEALYDSSASTISKISSERLSENDKLKLISGIWTREMTVVDTSEASNSEIQIVESARKKVNELYNIGCYPFNFESKYDNWYSWNTTLYKFTDSNFKTYTTYLWKISFCKYDSDEIHDVYLTDDNVLIAVCNNSPKLTKKNNADRINTVMKQYLSEYYLPTKKINNYNYITNLSTNDFPIYDFLGLDTTGINSINLAVTEYPNIHLESDIEGFTSITIPNDATLFYEFHGEIDNHYIIFFYPFTEDTKNKLVIQ